MPSKSNKSAAKSTKSNVAVEAPALPSTASLPITDPSRRLTREEWKSMSKEDKAARKAARATTRGPASERFARGVARYATRFTRMAKLFEGTALQAEFVTLSTTIRNLAGDVSELPATWTPQYGHAARVAIEAGAKVVLVPSKLEMYKDIVEGELTVVKVAGKRVVVQPESGPQLFLPIGHVTIKKG